MARHANLDWDLPSDRVSWEQVNTALLMDIRDELKRLNKLLACPNFVAIPQKLNMIVANTAKGRRRRGRKARS